MKIFDSYGRSKKDGKGVILILRLERKTTFEKWNAK
jgi:hypothetical protein